MEGALGCATGGGVITAPRLQAARLQQMMTELHLMLQPRGAFSDLAAVPVEGCGLFE